MPDQGNTLLAASGARSGLPAAIEASDRAERWARYVPLAIIIYFAVQALLRLVISDNFEIDEAEVVGHAGFALGYYDSQPPLYDWIAIALQRATGSWLVGLSLAKNALLAATYLLYYRTGRILFGTFTGGAVLSLSLLFMPQIVWQSQVTLAHSVAAAMGCAWVIASLVLLLERQTTGRFVWLGVATAFALLGKYNALLLVFGLAAAIATLPDVRRRFASAGLLLSVAVAAVLVASHLYWALGHMDASTSRLRKLMVVADRYNSLDLPYLGIDGLLSLLASLAASSLPLVLVWWIGNRIARREVPTAPLSRLAVDAVRISVRTLQGTLAAVALGALAFDLHQIYERYLITVLMPLPLALATLRPLALKPRAPQRFFLTAAVVAAIVTLSWPLKMMLGRNDLSFPFAEMAAQIRTIAGPNTAVMAAQGVDEINLSRRIEGSKAFKPNQPPGRIVVVDDGAKGVDSLLIKAAGSCYRQSGPVHSLAAPYRFFSGRTARLSMVVLEPDAAALAAGCLQAGDSYDPAT